MILEFKLKIHTIKIVELKFILQDDSLGSFTFIYLFLIVRELITRKINYTFLVKI